MTTLIHEPKLKQSTFSLLFPRQQTIRRLANEFEDVLKGHYQPPQLIPVPDDFDQDAPRLIFQSSHGFSSLVITQVALIMTVNYSPDWQSDFENAKTYILDRISILYELLGTLKKRNKGVTSLYSGLGSLVQIAVAGSDSDVFELIASRLSINPLKTGLYDLSFKTATVESNIFFNNLTIDNYRGWTLNQISSPPKLDSKSVSERGVQLLGDYNDKFAYQERQKYSTTINRSVTIVNRGFEIIQDTIATLRDINEPIARV